MKKIVIITEKFGELGNRLFRFARIFSLTEEASFYLVDLTFFQYSYLYAPKNYFLAFLFIALQFLNNQRLKAVEKYLSSSKWVTLLKGPPRQRGDEILPIHEIKDEIEAASMPLLLLKEGGFFFSCHDMARSTKEKLRRIFHLKKKYLSKAESLLQKKEGAFLEKKYVGVHLRQGDYKTYADGIYYFEEAVYAASMRHLLATYQGPGSITFVLITKEKIHLRDFEGLPFQFFENQSIGVDQALLQLCDYIISPKSTFSSWASFLYDIPQGIIQSRTIPLEWSDFQVAEASPQINQCP